MNISEILSYVILIGTILIIMNLWERLRFYIAKKTNPDFAYRLKRVRRDGVTIYITRKGLENHINIETEPVIKFTENPPVLNFYEDGVLYRSFTIEPKDENPDLTGQYFHASIRINANSSVQVDGFISKNKKSYNESGEGIRFQPFFLSDNDDKNRLLKGKGMFERGLHYAGRITPANIRLVCLCDSCNNSFSVRHFHAGFSQVQYFYSSNSKETLMVPYNTDGFAKMPSQLQIEINEQDLVEVEAKLPFTSDGSFAYYNNFKCPHCGDDYINFQQNKEIRPGEYYANYYLNEEIVEI